MAAMLDQKKRGVLQQPAKFLQILRAQRAIDHAMIAAHADAHSLTRNDLVAIVDDRFLHDRADRQNKTLRRIDDGGEIIDAVARRDLKR